MAKSKEVFKEIENIVGRKYVSDADFVRQAYARNVDAVLPDRLPDFIVRPGSTGEIQEIVRVANRYEYPIIQRGAGCDLTGGASPIEPGGLILEMTRMRKILDLDESGMAVTVETGISWGELNYVLGESGYYTGTMGPGSGMASTIGGGLSNNTSGGGGAFKYETCTAQCLGMDVVLPNGDLIKTGSSVNQFVKRPFSRYVNGPDMTGIFCGDSGLFGIKTKATIRIFKKEKFVNYKTFSVNEPDSVKKATNIISQIQREEGLGCWDLYFIPLGTAILLKMSVVESWKKLPKKAAIMFYVSVAHNEEELNANVNRLDEIFRENGAEALGPEIEDGNWAKYHWEKQGHWLYFHYAWGGRGAGSMATASCHMIRTDDLPKWNDMFTQWYIQKQELLAKANGAQGSYTVFTLPNHIDFVHGFIFFNKPEYRELNNQIRNDWARTFQQAGGCNYWLGESLSRAMVDNDVLADEYYAFLKTLKKTLDPNRVLSPGKFYL